MKAQNHKRFTTFSELVKFLIKKHNITNVQKVQKNLVVGKFPTSDLWNQKLFSSVEAKIHATKKYNADFDKVIGYIVTVGATCTIKGWNSGKLSKSFEDYVVKTLD